MGHIDEVHSNVTNFKCDESVNNITTLPTSINTFIYIVHGSIPNNVCEECGKVFISSSQLRDTQIK